MESDSVAVTLDVDWAPDFAIDFAASRLIAYGIRATWFITHLSPAIERLRLRTDLFELGIHPNFLPGSSHGATPSEILDRCFSFVPDALSVRTHCLVQSTPLLQQIATTRIRVDSSLVLPRTAHTAPFVQYFGGRPLCRVPVVWEDDFEMESPHAKWDPAPILACSGVRVFSLHPIHVFLNSASMQGYRQLKSGGSPLQTVSEHDASAYIAQGDGTRTMFERLLRDVPAEKTRWVRDFIPEEVAR